MIRFAYNEAPDLVYTYLREILDALDDERAARERAEQALREIAYGGPYGVGFTVSARNIARAALEDQSVPDREG